MGGIGADGEQKVGQLGASGGEVNLPKAGAKDFDGHGVVEAHEPTALVGIVGGEEALQDLIDIAFEGFLLGVEGK